MNPPAAVTGEYTILTERALNWQN